MNFIDISMPISEDMPTWAGQELFGREEVKSGDSIISKLKMYTHTGTHIDAPKHFLGEDADSVGKLSIETYIGPCKVIGIEGSAVTADELKQYEINEGDRILFRTRNSEERLLEQKEFTREYVALDLGAAEYLAMKKITLVGIDYLGIEAKGNAGHPVHKTLLKNNIVIVEGLNLAEVNPGEYNLAVLPLKILDADGAPARAVLWT